MLHSKSCNVAGKDDQEMILKVVITCKCVNFDL